MNNLHLILKLTTLTVLLTIGLLAFTLINKSDFEGSELLGCATVGSIDDVVPLNKYSTPLEHPGQKVFQANCKACHHLDFVLVGPALRNSFEDRDSIWFVRMITSANDLIASGDTLAVRLFNDYNQTRHTDFRGLDKTELTDLVEYLKLEGLRDDGE